MRVASFIAPMRTISRRPEKLEARFAPLAETEHGRRAADLHASLRRLAGHLGEPLVAQLEGLLEEIGPDQFHNELLRAELIANGFVQGPNESLADTVGRALGIGMKELKVCVVQGRVGAALVERFRQPENRLR